MHHINFNANNPRDHAALTDRQRSERAAWRTSIHEAVSDVRREKRKLRRS